MRICVTAIALLLGAGSAQAQTPLKIASPENVDEDFAFQGEYTGLILPEDSSCLRRIGLQVIARGDGQFDAVAHTGGLPGAGATSEKVSLQGRRDGEVLELSGESLSARIENRRASLVSARGNTLGSFYRVIRKSPTLGIAPPAGAVVLFDGSNTDEFVNGKMTDDGLLKEGTEFKRSFRDYTLHIEFRLAYSPTLTGQKRSNSGVYLQSRYEVQVLDSFGLEGAINECGALYRYRKPDVNMCLPPLSWQTYDITFISPRFDSDGNKTRNARLTVCHNGVVIHNNFEVERKTGAGKKETPELFPIKLQNHSDPVRFRNIWVVEHSGEPACCPPSQLASSPLRPARSARLLTSY